MATVKEIMAARRKMRQAPAPKPETNESEEEDESTSSDADSDGSSGDSDAHESRQQGRTPASGVPTTGRPSKRRAARRGIAAADGGGNGSEDDQPVDLADGDDDDDDDEELAAALQESEQAGAASAERERSKRAKARAPRAGEQREREAVLAALQQLKEIKENFDAPGDTVLEVEDDDSDAEVDGEPEVPQDVGKLIHVTVQASGASSLETRLGLNERVSNLISRFAAVAEQPASGIRLKFEGDAADPEATLKSILEDLDDDELEEGVRFDAYMD